MNAKRHALLARQLIAACDGLAEAAENCRVETSSLSRFCDPGSGHFMPADVMADLEQYCGEPIYSRALAEGRPAIVQTESLLDEACETTERSATLQQIVRKALADGTVTAAERAEIAAALVAFDDQARELRAAGDKVIAA